MRYQDFDESTKVILKVIFAVLILVFLWTVREVIFILLFSLILASALDPLVDYFSEKRVPRAVSVLTVYVLFLGIVGVVIYLLIPPVIEQFKLLTENLPQYYAALHERLGSTLLANLDLSSSFKQMFVSGGGGSFVVQTFSVFSGALAFLSVLVISFYLVAEEKGLKQFIAALLPEHHQEASIVLIEKIQKKMGLWVLGQIILSFAIFAFSWIGLSLLGIKYALFLALLAGVLEVVPYIGPFLSAVPAVLFAFIQNPTLALAVAILYLLIQKTEGYVLVPKVMQKTVGTSPLVVLVALLVGFKLAGVVGLLISVPLVSALTVVVNEFWGPKPSKE